MTSKFPSQKEKRSLYIKVENANDEKK